MTPLRLKLGDILWKKAFRPYLFGKNAEDAHLFTIRTLKLMQEEELLWLVRLFYRSPYFDQKVVVAGRPWRNKVGLAAGFDKQIEVLPALDAFGFGSAEVGTITWQPQYGSPQPRVFRYQGIRAIINRYGFNSVGAEQAAKNLGKIYRRHRVNMPIGISIGKNKDTPDERAVNDYLGALRYFIRLIRPQDWVKINISSPNTPGLRELFGRLDEFLGELKDRVRQLAQEFGASVPRLMLKVPPDNLSDEQIVDVVKVAVRCGFCGIEATNTTTDQQIKRDYGLTETGGLSGEPLRERSTRVLAVMKEPARGVIDLIGVGGISEAWHFEEKILAGAKALQIYTGLVFRGPNLLHEILSAEKDLLR